METGGTIDPVERFLNFRIPNIELNSRTVMSKKSCDMRPGDWVVIGKSVIEACEAGFDGVVVTHGTDTLPYSAAALSFMIQGLPIPVVFTGSAVKGRLRRSYARNNLRNSILTATSELAEVCVVFSDSEVGKNAAIIRGTRCRKVRASRINAFASINVPPIGAVQEGHVSLFPGVHFRKRSTGRPSLKAGFKSEVSLIRSYPSIAVEHIKGMLESSAGIVIEGYGSGDTVSDARILEALHSFHGPIAVSNQGTLCDYDKASLNHQTKANTYLKTIQNLSSRSITLLRPQRGILATPNVIPVRDMLTEVALVKLMWILGNGLDPRRSLTTNYCGEINE